MRMKLRVKQATRSRKSPTATAALDSRQFLVPRLHLQPHLLSSFRGCVSDNKQTGSAAHASDPIFKCNNNCALPERTEPRIRGGEGRAPFRPLSRRPGLVRPHYIVRPDAIKWEIAVVPTLDGGRPSLSGETGGNSVPAARNGPDILHGSRVSLHPSRPPHPPHPLARFAVRRRALLLTREAPAAPIPSVSTASCPSRSVSIHWLIVPTRSGPPTSLAHRPTDIYRPDTSFGKFGKQRFGVFSA